MKLPELIVGTNRFHVATFYPLVRRMWEIVYGDREFDKSTLRHKGGSSVGRNIRCNHCGFPNYDYQVAEDTMLCKECEIALIAHLVLTRTCETFGWGKPKNNEFRKMENRYLVKLNGGNRG